MRERHVEEYGDASVFLFYNLSVLAGACGQTIQLITKHTGISTSLEGGARGWIELMQETGLAKLPGLDS